MKNYVGFTARVVLIASLLMLTTGVLNLTRMASIDINEMRDNYNMGYLDDTSIATSSFHDYVLTHKTQTAASIISDQPYYPGDLSGQASMFVYFLTTLTILVAAGMSLCLVLATATKHISAAKNPAKGIALAIAAIVICAFATPLVYWWSSTQVTILANLGEIMDAGCRVCYPIVHAAFWTLASIIAIFATKSYEINETAKTAPELVHVKVSLIARIRGWYAQLCDRWFPETVY